MNMSDFPTIRKTAYKKLIENPAFYNKEYYKNNSVMHLKIDTDKEGMSVTLCQGNNFL